MAKQFGCRFIEASAKQRVNVDEAFYSLVREIRRYNKELTGAGKCKSAAILGMRCGTDHGLQQIQTEPTGSR